MGIFLMRPDGGIGRRCGFKIRWPRGRGGSSPLSGHLKDRISDLLSEAMLESLDYQG